MNSARMKLKDGQPKTPLVRPARILEMIALKARLRVLMATILLEETMNTSPKQNGLFEPAHRIDSEWITNTTGPTLMDSVG